MELDKQIEEKRVRKEFEKSQESVSDSIENIELGSKRVGRRSIETILKIEAHNANPMPMLTSSNEREKARLTNDEKQTDYFWGSIGNLKESSSERTSVVSVQSERESSVVVVQQEETPIETPIAKVQVEKPLKTRKSKLPVKTTRAQQLRLNFIVSPQQFPSSQFAPPISKPRTRSIESSRQETLEIEQIKKSALELLEALNKLSVTKQDKTVLKTRQQLSKIASLNKWK